MLAPPEEVAVCQESVEPKKPVKVKPAKRQRSGLIPAMLVVLALGLAGYAGIHYAAQELSRSIPPPMVDLTVGETRISDENYIRTGWQKDAYQVLDNYLQAGTSDDKAAHVLNGGQLAAVIEDFHGGGMRLVPAEVIARTDIDGTQYDGGLRPGQAHGQSRRSQTGGAGFEQ